MILFAEEGFAFRNTAGGDSPFSGTMEQGVHGHDPALPHLHATFVAWGAGIKPGVSSVKSYPLRCAYHRRLPGPHHTQCRGQTAGGSVRTISVAACTYYEFASLTRQGSCHDRNSFGPAAR